MSRHQWTKAEKRYIQQNYTTLTHAEMAAHLGVSVCAVSHCIYRMGYKCRQLKKWTEEEEAVLMELHGTMPATQIAEKLGRDKVSVWSKMRDMGLSGQQRRDYTEEEKNFVKYNSGSMTSIDIAQCLGRPAGSVRSHIKRHGYDTLFKNKVEHSNEIYAGVVTLACQGKTVKEIAEHFNMTADSMRMYMRKRNIDRKVLSST